MGKDDISSTVFKVVGLSTDDFLDAATFGIRLTSVSDNKGGREESSKVTGSSECCRFHPPPPPPAPVCGNGIVEDGEDCDGGDGCTEYCKMEDPVGNPVCGNGIVEDGEDCDGGDGCTEDCKNAECPAVCSTSACTATRRRGLF